MPDRQPNTRQRGRIIKGVGGLYTVAGEQGERWLASARGIFRRTRQTPLPGDWAILVPSGDPDKPWRIEALEPRRNEWLRPAAANLDALLIVVATTEPLPDLLLVDKLLAMAADRGLDAALAISKTDLGAMPDELIQAYEKAGYRCWISHSEDPQSGLPAICAWLAGRAVCLAGQSGAGKSTLLNRLAGEELMPTGELSERIGRGRQTTREVVFFPVCGGFLADSPGFSALEVDQLGLDGNQVAAGYPELHRIAGQCRFNDCRHLEEPDCAVDEQTIDPGRLQRYRTLRRTADAMATDWPAIRQDPRAPS